MLGLRKIIINQNEIQQKIHYNNQLESEYYGQNFKPAYVDVPAPIYTVEEYYFRLHQVNSFYIEKNRLLQGKPEKDIIANILYEGLVRFQYDPVLESKLTLSFSE